MDNANCFTTALASILQDMESEIEDDPDSPSATKDIIFEVYMRLIEKSPDLTFQTNFTSQQRHVFEKLLELLKKPHTGVEGFTNVAACMLLTAKYLKGTRRASDPHTMATLDTLANQLTDIINT